MHNNYAHYSPKPLLDLSLNKEVAYFISKKMYKIISKFYVDQKKAEQDARRFRKENLKAEVEISPKGLPMVVLGTYKCYSDAEKKLKELFYKIECYLFEIKG